MADFHKYVVARSKTGGKFWEVEVEDTTVRIRYGKIGDDKKWSVSEHDSAEKALKEAQKKLTSKMNKGYTEDAEIKPWDLAARIDALEKALRDHPEIVLKKFERYEPLTDEVLAGLEASLGFQIDPRFTQFFRITNGLKVEWTWKTQSEDEWPHIIDLESLSGCAMSSYSSALCRPGEYHERALGGWDMHELGKGPVIDNFHTDNFYNVRVIMNADYVDPPVLLTNDYDASWGDYHPMLARHYIEWVIATAGVYDARFWIFEGRGAGGNHELFVPREDWLDGFPSVDTVLDYSGGHGRKNPEGGSFVYMKAAERNELAIYFKSFFSQRIPVDKTPYAHYNKPNNA